MAIPREPRRAIPSLRVIRDGTTHDYNLIKQDSARILGPVVENGAIVTQWLVDQVLVTQRIRFILNPYTNREDQASIVYTVRNTGSASVQAGVRCMLDIQVGAKDPGDRAPFFIPGVGNTNTEHEFFAGNMPDYFKAFESPSYAADSLRAQGILKGSSVTTPDRFCHRYVGSIE